MVSNAVLPFIFACFVERRSYWRAGLTLVLLLLFYPITLNKIAFFTPTWLLAMAILTRLLDSRIAVVLSLLVPLFIGIVLYVILGISDTRYLDIINLRMIATPSNAMDIYNDFFFNHPLTSFCQITFVKTLVSCPYPIQLGEVMQKAYGLGNYTWMGGCSVGWPGTIVNQYRMLVGHARRSSCLPSTARDCSLWDAKTERGVRYHSRKRTTAPCETKDVVSGTFNRI